MTNFRLGSYYTLSGNDVKRRSKASGSLDSPSEPISPFTLSWSKGRPLVVRPELAEGVTMNGLLPLLLRNERPRRGFPSPSNSRKSFLSRMVRAFERSKSLLMPKITLAKYSPYPSPLPNKEQRKTLENFIAHLEGRRKYRRRPVIKSYAGGLCWLGVLSVRRLPLAPLFLPALPVFADSGATGSVERGSDGRRLRRSGRGAGDTGHRGAAAGVRQAGGNLGVAGAGAHRRRLSRP